MLNPGCDMTAISGKLTESPFSLRLYPGTEIYARSAHCIMVGSHVHLKY